MPPRPLFLLLAIAAPALLGGCATGDRGLASRHQPIVSATAATVKGCPDWSDAEAGSHEGNGSNYGCATAMNLAAMIADPLDLVRGHTADGTGGAEVAARAMKAWRDSQTGKGGLEKVSAKGGS